MMTEPRLIEHTVIEEETTTTTNARTMIRKVRTETRVTEEIIEILPPVINVGQEEISEPIRTGYRRVKTYGLSDAEFGELLGISEKERQIRLDIICGQLGHKSAVRTRINEQIRRTIDPRYYARVLARDAATRARVAAAPVGR